MCCAVLLYMVLVKGVFNMLNIQDTELMQLMHEQNSSSWLNERNQRPTFEWLFKGYFLLPVTFSIFALLIGPII
jgi:hypothetical protein